MRESKWHCMNVKKCFENAWCVHTENSLSYFCCILLLESFVKVTFSYSLYGFSINIKPKIADYKYSW